MGFAVVDGRKMEIVNQSATCLLFIGAACGAFLLTPIALPALYILHGIWALAHHRTALPIPGWYVPLCLVCDVLAALALWAMWLF